MVWACKKREEDRRRKASRSPSRQILADLGVLQSQANETLIKTLSRGLARSKRERCPEAGGNRWQNAGRTLAGTLAMGKRLDETSIGPVADDDSLQTGQRPCDVGWCEFERLRRFADLEPRCENPRMECQILLVRQTIGVRISNNVAFGQCRFRTMSRFEDGSFPKAHAAPSPRHFVSSDVRPTTASSTGG
jgi:hypothetical protein